VAAVLEPFSLPFVQRGLAEVLLLAVGAGVLGTWIVLRGLAFFVHAVGTAAFPGLVLADGLAFAAPLGAAGTAAAFAVAVTWLGRGRRTGQDAVVALVLVGCLAAGVILASDVFHSGATVETLLFGSLLVIGNGQLVLAGCASAAALVCSLVLGERWLARGFDPQAVDALRLRSGWHTLALLGIVALTAVASLQAIGGLLVTALFVVPAATTRLLCRRLPTWQISTVALVAAEGVAGLWLSVKTDTPPGAAIAVVAGAVFALVAAARMLGRPWVLPAIAAAGALALAGCTAQGHGEKKAVATTTQLADIARQIAGPQVEVVGILRPNTDPHEYEPRPSDVEATAGAKLVLLSGHGLDAWMTRVLHDAGGKPRVLDIGALVSNGSDPHWWHDPRNVESAVPRIRDALIAAIPAHAAEIRRRAAAYAARVRALDRRIARCFASIAPAQRKLVTDHDAFGYFARRYGITIVGAVIPSLSTQAQASAGELARLAATIRREHVRAVFPESSISPKVARALARQTGASASYTLYGDTLGPAGSPGATYIGMEQANADAMMRGFTGGRRGCPA
jgi:ABC-type Zn uptake system ZnuABC Zn-binding protein ZnuA/ABC-type Mn2+/Zn2+ transport system permease subunit